MNKIRLTMAVLFILMMSIGTGEAASTKAFLFDPPTTFMDGTALNPATDIDHYTVKWGTASGAYTTVVNIGKVTSYVIQNVTPGSTVYAVVSATTATTGTHAGNIESANSNEAVYSVPANTTPASGCSNARFAP